MLVKNPMSLSIPNLRAGAEEPLKYLDDVFRYAKARLGNHDDAEDVAIEVVQALPHLCRKDNLRLFMIGMARRKVADRLRRKSGLPLEDFNQMPAFDRASDEAATVESVLCTLVDDQREALILKYVIGMSSQEVGGVMKRGASAIDSLLQRARDAFEKEWNRIHEPEEHL